MKKQLSSPITFVHKFLPLVLFPYLLVWLIVGGIQSALFGTPNTLTLVVSFFALFVIGILVFWITLPLKTVWIENDHLKVSDFFRKIDIPASEIEKVEGPDFTSHQRIKIVLASNTDFGRIIIFTPPLFRASETVRLLRTLSR